MLRRIERKGEGRGRRIWTWWVTGCERGGRDLCGLDGRERDEDDGISQFPSFILPSYRVGLIRERPHLSGLQDYHGPWYPPKICLTLLLFVRWPMGQKLLECVVYTRWSRSMIPDR